MGSRGQSSKKAEQRAQARAAKAKVIGSPDGTQEEAAVQTTGNETLATKDENATKNASADAFFKDESAKTIFYLLHMGGKERTDYLGLTEDLYEDASKARSWYVRMSKLVHPDNTDNPEAANAFREIQRIYGRMKKTSEYEGDSTSKAFERMASTATRTAASDSGYGNAFFRDESSKTVFYLLHMSGEQRTDFLGISEDLYGNPAKARSWYTRMSKLVHPDNTSNPEAEKAFREVQRIYKRMTR